MSFDSLATTLTSPNYRSVERNGTLTGLERPPYTVLAVAGARVYHTGLNAKDNQWTYSRWKGTLSFCRDVDTVANSGGQSSTSDAEKHWFRLADDETGRTVWMFKFPESFNYVVDRPFFHVFQGRTRRYGFLFDDDDEAFAFVQKVNSQIYVGRPQPQSKKSKSTKSINSSNNSSRIQVNKVVPVQRPVAIRTKSAANGVSASMISAPAPNSFKHVTHVGLGKDGVFEASKDLDASWKSMLASLQGYGVSEEIVIRHTDFVEGYWKGVEAVRTLDSSEVRQQGASRQEMPATNAIYAF